MPEVEVKHGMFSWADLSTPDPSTAKRFYGEVFGWEARDEPAGDHGVYTIFERAGRAVAGMGEQSVEMQDAGAPPTWSSYVTVDDVDGTVARTVELGGDVTLAPMEVMEAGRMAMIQDPTGAVVCLWEPRGHTGADLFNEHGAMTWNELATRDLESASAFFGELLRWDFEEMEVGGSRYRVIHNAGRPNGGILLMNEEWPDEVPAHWMVYFAVDDVDASAAQVEASDGTICVPAFDAGVGRICVVDDPTGATFTLFAQADEGT